MTIKKAIERFQGWLDEGYHKINKQTTDWREDKEALELAIQCMKDKRLQGKWILQSRTPGFFGRDDVDNFKCSVCGKITSHTYAGVVENEITPYCPQCGASMSKDIERMF